MVIKKISGTCILATLMACQSASKPSNSNDVNAIVDTIPQYYVVVGSYDTPSQPGAIGVYTYDTNTGHIQIASKYVGVRNPSYVTANQSGTCVYAVSETEDSTAAIYAFNLGPRGILTPTGHAQTRGEAPCYLALSPDGKTITTANYGGGSITSFRLTDDGSLQDKGHLIPFYGHGSDPIRQASSHAHFVSYLPQGRTMVVNDLGTDRIHLLALDTTGLPLTQGERTLSLPSGSGPRHMVYAPNGRDVYLLSEISGEVFTLRIHGESLQYEGRMLADSLHAKGSADIHISPDGRYLYTSHRLKGDGLSIFAINTSTGALHKVGYTPTGEHPRNFALSPDGIYILVACRDANQIELYKRDTSTGMLHFVYSIPYSKPSSIRFVTNTSNT